MNSPDPFAVLGVEPTATLAEVRSARRRLALRAHPDRGGDEARMREINAAFDAAVKRLLARPGRAPRGAPAPEPAPTPSRRPPPRPRPATAAPGSRRVRVVDRDEASFVVQAAVAEAFEALRLATPRLGALLAGESDSWLEGHLTEPGECWCRLELLPEGAGTMVAITLGHVEGTPWPPPAIDDVRDAWITALGALSSA
jgi:DnaJ domain